ncbi:uncharacterized protein SPPG_02764 [Spizellomyces punctatus DAOM BR117]|uniref:PEP-CTERM system TPR-repeat lipoprotein n=1 Tax=Spizellomyces punctatus (strain DAOM BR117) TaxID=645134 RepID=A0A0L0HNA3_SPIPD|nr:uncharacterized protein SPPG_02764 [Spizellomyces punctatus DAOM BR117]KND02289.1 hypothetical protein SPPG_02764 [Spizellomyces punctatus DAOM BR117]|eukprot:XP_016610328.1 hypothetical protein SPPG_02764 [Spizellomyces punctatus DAOM BR117]
MSADEDLAAINYFCRRKLFHHAYSLCDDRLKRKVGDPLLLFWRAASTVFEGRPTEALRALESVQDKRDFLLAAPIAMIHAHERCKLVDREAIQELEAKLTIASNSPSLTDRAHIQAAMFQWHCGFLDLAKENVKKALDMNSGSTEALTLMGWIDMASPKDSVAAKAHTWLDRALEKRPKDLEALMGRLHYLRRHRRQLTPALDITSQIIVHYPGFIPAYIERVYVLLEMGAWEQVNEASQRLAGLMPDSIDAMIAQCLNQLCREGGYAMAASYIAKLKQTLDRLEPHNAQLYYTTAQPFIRLSNRLATVLDGCTKLLEKAIVIEPENSAYRTELGHVHLLLEDLPRAREAYQHAASLDPHYVKALEGLIRCQLLSGHFDAAEEQLELFNEFQMAMGKSAEMTYLSSVLAWYKYGDARKRLQYLKEAVEIELQLINAMPLSLEYYVQVNPDFLLEMVKDYMEHCPSDPKREGEDVHPIIKIVLDLLEVVCKVNPGSVEAVYHLAKAKFLAGDKASAQLAAARCLKLDNTYPKGYVLMGQIHLYDGHAKQAIQFLEMGLSYNFQVRNIPLFHILKARVQITEGNYDEALATLQTAMSLPGMKEPMREGNRVPRMKRPDHIPSIHERMTLYLELVDVHTKLKHVNEAAKVMQEAVQVFSGMPEQDRLVMAKAELALARGEVDAALNQLATITMDQPYFIEAKRQMADIYLKYKNDKKAYARCYSELVERNPTVESCLLLGDAYMNLQEPEKAIAIYESAMDSSPEASVLASKIGKALVRTHNYSRAISYYESALANESPIGSILRYDLAQLYKKLQRYDDAEKILTEALEHPQTDEISDIELDISCQTLLAQVYRCMQNPKKAVMALQEARDLQMRVLAKEAMAADTRPQRTKLADINYEIAELYSRDLKEVDNALTHYNEAIENDEGHAKSILAVCQIYLSKGEVDSAQLQCSNLLRLDTTNEEATMLMAEIMYRSNSHAEAIFHFRSLLDRIPTHYTALVRLIEVLRRSGKLDEIPKYLKLAEESTVKVNLHPGYHYCKGLHYRYSNSPHEALKEFNFCRRDTEWGERALYHMVEIFLNPDNETTGGEALEGAADTSASGGKKGDSELLAILTADKLLKELPQNPKSLRTQVLECHALMATKQKVEIERALAKFAEILNTERDYVPALLGMAVGYMLLKQPPRARNQLKRIAKMEWTSELADDFERSWILLADIYIQGGKYDLATDLLKRCLSQNRSCAKASEYLGFIMEKEASFKDAADHYEIAWQLDREANPAMGYKLAFNYMKAKKHVEAIDVCHKVLKLYPDYPKMRKEILDKARASLRCP